MQKNKTRLVALLLAVVLVISMMPTSFAASLTDIKGHWAEEYINYGVSAGYISGYTNGTFRPNNTVTRAEFSKMVNTALGIQHAVSVTFTDVAASEWYYEEVRKAVSAGYISGYADNTFGAGRNITRQEAAVMLSRIVTEPEATSNATYKDASSIDSWATAAISKMAAKTYMQGDQNNNFRPKAALTRAEAAKILYEVLKNEIIASTNQSFSIAGSSYYNTIYPNNVTVTEGVTGGAVSFNSCRILGTLTASGGLDSTVNLSNTGVNQLIAASASGESKVALTGTSYVTKTVVNNGVTLSGSAFGTVSLNGENLSSDTVRLLGDFDTVNLSTSAVVKASGGTIGQFTIYDRVTLMLQAGNITRLDLEGDAKNSSIALSDGVSIQTAYIKAAADFTGMGEIKTAYEGNGTVTYENRPTSVVGGSSQGNDDDDYDDDYNYDSDTDSLIPSFYPKNGASGISDEPTIRLTFGDTVYRSASKTALSVSHVEDRAVELREGSLSGYSVPFTATLNSNKSVITISPDEYLESNTRYYIVLVADTVYDENGESNGRVYASFVTGGSSDYYDEEVEGRLIPTMTPNDGKTNVSRSSTVRLAFGDTVYRSSGSTLSTSYLENNCIEIREDSVSGTLVSFSASLNSAKSIITLTPSERWKEDTTYYVVIPRDTLSDRDDNLNTRFVARFSTGATVDGSDIQFTPDNGDEDVALDPEITIAFDSPVYRYEGGTVDSRYLEETVLSLRRGSTSGTQVSFTAQISSNKRTITIIPDEALQPNTTYYVRINSYALQYGSNKTVPLTTSSFKTSDGTLRISNLSVGEIASSTADVYVTPNTTGTVYVTLKANGETALSQSVFATAGRQTAMSFTGLSQNTEYTVTAYVKDGAGRTSVEKKETFKTATLSFDLEADDITKKSAVIKASFSTVGSISINYKKAGELANHSVLSNFTPNKVGTKEIALTGLAEGTSYIVFATFTDASENVITREITFTTETTSSETGLKSLTINLADGTSKVDILPNQDTYEISIANTDRITITPVAVDSRATISVAGSMVNSGATSSYIYVSAGGTKTITITVRSESGAYKNYTLKVKVAANA